MGRIPEWVEPDENDLVGCILRDDFEALNFEVNGVHYCFSGWWMLDFVDSENDFYKFYDSREEFLNDPVFDGKTFAEADVKVLLLEFHP